MKHIIIGGRGFVGRQLAQDLRAQGETVVVADLAEADPRDGTAFVAIDITARETLDALPVEPEDAVYNLSARMLSPILPRAERHDFFWPVNHDGVRNLIDRMDAAGCRQLVHFTTDMIYGHSVVVPQTEEHPARPLGEYGASKLASETLCREARSRGFRISIFRPRLIIGPGRLGILTKLFRLIDLNLPVPMIGAGANPYQFISVYDCASACAAAWRAGFPNSEYNLGSDDPPPVRALLRRLVEHAGSRSLLLPTPAPAVKATLDLLDLVNRPLMDPEQYKIADEICILDTNRAKRELGWKPEHRDEDMLLAAYAEYRKGLQARLEPRRAA